MLKSIIFIYNFFFEAFFSTTHMKTSRIWSPIRPMLSIAFSNRVHFNSSTLSTKSTTTTLTKWPEYVIYFGYILLIIWFDNKLMKWFWLKSMQRARGRSNRSDRHRRLARVRSHQLGVRIVADTIFGHQMGEHERWCDDEQRGGRQQ